MSGRSMQPSPPGALNGRTELPEVTVSSYVPRPRDWLYLAKLEELIDENVPPTLRALGNRLHMWHVGIMKWQRRRGFLPWLTQQLHAVRMANRVLIERRFEQAAMRGSVKHAEVLAKLNQWGGYGALGVAGDRRSARNGLPLGTSIANFNLVLGAPLTPIDPNRPRGLPLPSIRPHANPNEG